MSAPRAAAVLLSTALGPGFLAAARSVLAQDLGVPIQLLVGIAGGDGDRGMVDRLRAECPGEVLLTVADPGLPPPGAADALYDGPGIVGLALAHLAHSPFLAFLDDRHRWTATHLSSLRRAIEGRNWAAAHCTSETTGAVSDIDARPALDQPNLLMVDKQRDPDALLHWVAPRGLAPARGLLAALRAGGAGGETGMATVVVGGAGEDRAPARQALPPLATAVDLATALAPWRAADAGALDPDGAATVPAEIAGLPRLIERLRPEAAIVLGGEADRVALSIAREARRSGLATIVAAIDPFLGTPDDLAHDARRAALPRGDLYPLLLGRLRTAIAREGLRDRLVAVASEPGPVIAALRAAGVRVALGHAELGAEHEDFLLDLDRLWPLIAPGGAVLGRIDWPDRVGREMRLRRWAARAGAGLSIAPAGPDRRATVALRRR